VIEGAVWFVIGVIVAAALACAWVSAVIAVDWLLGSLGVGL
jgi:hypothetical protein